MFNRMIVVVAVAVIAIVVVQQLSPAADGGAAQAPPAENAAPKPEDTPRGMVRQVQLRENTLLALHTRITDKGCEGYELACIVSEIDVDGEVEGWWAYMQRHE